MVDLNRAREAVELAVSRAPMKQLQERLALAARIAYQVLNLGGGGPEPEAEPE